MNTKLHAICDSRGRPLNLFVTAGQVSDYIGARALVGSLPNVEWLLGDRGYDADWFREALKDKGTRARVPGRKQRKTPVKYDKRRYKRRNRIEIMFGRLKDWRPVATRYDRCPKVFLRAIGDAKKVTFSSMCWIVWPCVDGDVVWVGPLRGWCAFSCSVRAKGAGCMCIFRRSGIGHSARYRRRLGSFVKFSMTSASLSSSGLWPSTLTAWMTVLFSFCLLWPRHVCARLG